MCVTFDNMPPKPPKGRPPGLLINPKAAHALLGNRTQLWWATQANVGPAHLNMMLAGTKGATPDVVDRLAEVLGVDPGALFPELVEFRTQVRHFVASAVA